MKENQDVFELLEVIKTVDSSIWESISLSDSVIKELKSNEEKISALLSDEDCKWSIESLISIIKNLSEIIVNQKESNIKITESLQEEKTKTEELKKEKEELYIDHLTEVGNRHRYNQVADEFILRFEEEWRQFSLTLLDLDDFKKVNDTYWHAIWDRVLKTFAKFLEWNLWNQSKLFRFGWEEFIVLSLLSKEEIKEKLNQLIKVLSTKVLKTREGQKIKFSFSGWSVDMTMLISDIKELEEKADDLLYQAKKNWKKQVL